MPDAEAPLNSEEKRHPGRDARGRFLPGTRVAGRKPGVPNKLTKLLRDAFEEAVIALQQDPEANLIAWAKTDPERFWTLAQKFCPRPVELEAQAAIKIIIQDCLKEDQAA